MGIVLFEDSTADQLSPVSLTRPTWAIRCASFCLADLLPRSHTISAMVRPHLQAILAADWTEFANPLTDIGSQPLAMVNARLAPTISNLKTINAFLEQQLTTATEKQIVVAGSGSDVAAAVLPGKFASCLSNQSSTDRISELEKIANDHQLEIVNAELPASLLNFPHDIIAEHMKGCREAIEFRIKNGSYREVDDGVFVASDGEKETQIPSSCHFDASGGPIVFEDNVRVGPLSFFRGPVHVDRNSKISEHSSIKDSVAIAHTCKMGGEIEGVQTEPWSNKQHFGFLGHSYIGSWINLGAGTCNSDLKNTYGTVNVVYGQQKVSTGMQFVGCVMGDYSRSAINTSIYTGKIIGVGSSVYGMTPHNVPSFVNCAQSLRQCGIVPADVLVTTQKRMFARRNVPQRDCDVRLIHDTFALTEHERDSSWTTDPIAF